MRAFSPASAVTFVTNLNENALVDANPLMPAVAAGTLKESAETEPLMPVLRRLLRKDFLQLSTL